MRHDYSKWITKIRQHALDNYEVSGWDYVIEAWSDDDLIGLFSFDNASSYGEAFKAVKDAVDYHGEQRAEIEATAW